MADRRIDDPAHMRAIAHPTRLRIVGLLRANGPQTAARLGDWIDEAPGTISYHCARLAAVGLIEAAPNEGGDRRERWWRAVDESTSWDLGDALGDPEKLLAATALDRALARVYAANYEAFVDRAPTFGSEWVSATLSSDRVMRLTIAELEQVRAELTAVIARWAPTSEAHIAGDGSEQVFVLQQAYRWARM